jgi:uncharacterized membrane protein
MKKGRLEAFSDGVIAIIITIMVLELKTPEGSSFFTLKPLIPVFISYIISFIYLGIYWNNHHHLISTVEHVSGGILWANLHLLFWLSLVPFATAWMGENHFAPETLSLYGFILLMCAIAYFILQRTIISHHGRNSLLAEALGTDFKGKLSPVLYLIAIPAAFLSEWISGLIYIGIAFLWLVPDKRIEKHLKKNQESS